MPGPGGPARGRGIISTFFPASELSDRHRAGVPASGVDAGGAWPALKSGLTDGPARCSALTAPSRWPQVDERSRCGRVSLEVHHHFAPQAHSSFSSRQGKVRGAGRLSETSCSWPPFVPFFCLADSFSRSGGLVSPGRRAGKGQLFSGRGDGAVYLCGAGRFPGVAGVVC